MSARPNRPQRPDLDPVRFSLLKQIRLSPAHYLHALTADKDNVLMRGGRAVDSYLLGGDQPVVYEGDRRGNAWKEFKAAHPDADIITSAEHDKANGMADAVRNHRVAIELLEGQRQAQIHWSFLGRDCVSHPDVFTHDTVVELKTCNTAEPGRFTWQAMKFAYHAQLAFYRQAVIASGMGRPQAAFIVVVESSAPYPVTVLRLTDRALDQGERLCRLWFERLLVCEAADHWPGYVESVVDLDVPEDEVALTFAAGIEAAGVVPF
jgi:hypothetical protein